MALSNGAYKIFNAQFVGQDADLFYGEPTGDIVGHSNNTVTVHMVWNLEVVNLPKVTLRNAAKSSDGAYAFVDNVAAGVEVHGDSDATQWSLIPYPALPGHYLISAPTLSDKAAQLVWTLSDDQDGTPITLEEAKVANKAQLWQFMKWDLD